LDAIRKIHAREVLDSRGKPTVEVEVQSESGAWGRSIVPSGASTGRSEAVELRDGDAQRYDGDGVLKAVAGVNDEIAPQLIDSDVFDQPAVDAAMISLDGTDQKERLGGNALLGVSLAVATAAAAARGVPLYEYLADQLDRLLGSTKGATARAKDRFVMPLPMTNMISGGLHAGGNLDFQDVLVMPNGAPDYRTGLEWTVRVYRRLGSLLTEAGYEGRLIGDEGGYGPRLPSNRLAVEFVVRAIESAGLHPGADMTIALDVAATHFQEGDQYRLATERDVLLSNSQMIDRLESWVSDFPITSVEDGLAEEDWAGWQELTRRLGDRVQLVGDDLFTTNVDRVRRGIELGAANSVLIKVNQIGTLTETLETIAAAKNAGYTLVVSARSGETEDTTIADLAVAVAADQIKIGSIVRSERLAKYNQLLRIEEQLNGGSGS
jgi:enolase